MSDSGRFTLTGADNPGIVHRVTTIISKHQLHIEKMETSDDDAPFGGTSLFQMECIATATAPLAKGFNAEQIKNELENLGDMMNCDISLETLYDQRDDVANIA